MQKKIGVIFVLMFILCGVCGADENDKLPQILRVQADKVTIVDSQSRLKILLAVSNHLGKEIIIKPKIDFKESVLTILKRAEGGKILHSRFGINSNIAFIEKKWGKPQGDYKEKNLRMSLYKDRFITLKYPLKGFRVKEVACHSFFNSPALPSLAEFKEGLGKPLKEYHLPDIIAESKKHGLDITKRLQEMGIAKKSTNVEKAIHSGDLDITVCLFKAGKYYFFVKECRIRKDTQYYRSIGVRTDQDILGDPWII